MMVRVADGFHNVQSAAGNILFKGRRITNGREDHDLFAF